MWYQYGCMFSTRIISTYDHLLHQAIATYMEKRKGGRGLMMDINISRKLKGKVLDSCVVPASTYGLDRLALSELHQHKLQVCENNWIRRIAGVKRVERRRLKDRREVVGTKAGIVGKIVKSRITNRPASPLHKGNQRKNNINDCRGWSNMNSVNTKWVVLWEWDSGNRWLPCLMRAMHVSRVSCVGEVLLQFTWAWLRRNGQVKLRIIPSSSIGSHVVYVDHRCLVFRCLRHSGLTSLYFLLAMASAAKQEAVNNFKTSILTWSKIHPCKACNQWIRQINDVVGVLVKRRAHA